MSEKGLTRISAVLLLILVFTVLGMISSRAILAQDGLTEIHLTKQAVDAEVTEEAPVESSPTEESTAIPTEPLAETTVEVPVEPTAEPTTIVDPPVVKTPEPPAAPTDSFTEEPAPETTAETTDNPQVEFTDEPTEAPSLYPTATPENQDGALLFLAEVTAEPLDASPTPTDAPVGEVSAEPGLACPAGMTPVDVQNTPITLLRNQYPTWFAHSVYVPETTTGTLIGASMVGHPEQQCRIGGGNDDRRYPCDQGQEHEEFYILIDGVQIAFIGDHGEDQWQTFSVELPAPLSRGAHEIMFQHSGQGTTPESVAYKALLCLNPPATMTPSPSPTLPPTIPPTLPPTIPPTLPPTLPPTIPPTLPPTLPPTIPPTLPPTLPPTQPPTLPPTLPPDEPLINPTPTATNPPFNPPTSTPAFAPTFTPSNPPVSTLAPTSGAVGRGVPKQDDTVCGQVGVTASGFPVIDLSLCGEDAGIARQPWMPLAVGGDRCPDWLVYHTDGTGDWELFRLGELENGVIADPNLSRGYGERVYDIMPSLSPDAKWITFASNRDGNWEIYISAVEEDMIQRVTYNNFAIDIDPMWSPAGNDIAYASNRDGDWELYMFNVVTGVETRLTTNAGSDINPFWSYDGTRILFLSDRDGLWQVYELDVATRKIRRISDGSGEDFDPMYSTDGAHILFRSRRDGGSSVIYMADADGSNMVRISDPAGNAYYPVLSPDGSLIAYQSDLDGDMDVYVYAVETGMTRKLTDNDVDDYAPTWICDSPTLVFTSDVFGNADLFSASALPISGDPIRVESDAIQLTFRESMDQYPLNTPPEENASAEDNFPPPVRSR